MQRDTLASSLTSSSNEPAPPSKEHLGLQKINKQGEIAMKNLR